MNALPEGQPSNNVPPLPADPSSWWPTGVPQSFAPVGAALLTFRALSNSSPRMRVLASLGALSVTGTGIIYHTALQKSVGFNRLL
jgi:hypothetical protein